MEPRASIFVAGHRGMVGSAILRRLMVLGHRNFILPSKAEIDLRRQEDAEWLFRTRRPQYVFLAAAKVGGIMANSTYPADFIYDNLMIEANIIHSANKYGTQKVLFLGSSCIYPKYCSQPMRESDLLTGPLEPTNEAYAVAKIAGIKMCEAYRKQFGLNAISLQPTNLYGPGDNYDLQSSHVLPAMLRKFHEAKLSGQDVVLWGTGSPRREFLHADDLASAAVFLMNEYDGLELVNVGVGHDITLRELADIVARVTNYQGQVTWDSSKPDGTPRKLLDVSKLNNMGWKADIELEEGIRRTYAEAFGVNKQL
jgi:GDP-L-fucose synthase